MKNKHHNRFTKRTRRNIRKTHRAGGLGQSRFAVGNLFKQSNKPNEHKRPTLKRQMANRYVGMPTANVEVEHINNGSTIATYRNSKNNTRRGINSYYNMSGSNITMRNNPMRRRANIIQGALPQKLKSFHLSGKKFL